MTDIGGYTVYVDPRDYPGRYVARRWTVRGEGLGAHIVPDPEPLAVAEDLETVREAITEAAPGLVCLSRMPDDDPAIYETWL